MGIINLQSVLPKLCPLGYIQAYIPSLLQDSLRHIHLPFEFFCFVSRPQWPLSSISGVLEMESVVVL